MAAPSRLLIDSVALACASGVERSSAKSCIPGLEQSLHVTLRFSWPIFATISSRAAVASGLSLKPCESSSGAGMVATQQFKSRMSRRGNPSSFDSAIFISAVKMTFRAFRLRLISMSFAIGASSLATEKKNLVESFTGRSSRPILAELFNQCGSLSTGSSKRIGDVSVFMFSILASIARISMSA